jgi:hypothetical protein
MAYFVTPDDGADDTLLAHRFALLQFDAVLGQNLSEGDGVISGVVTIDGLEPTSCSAVLIREESGEPKAMIEVAADGSYSFTGVPIGNWAVAIIDRTGGKRAKVVHTVLT